MVWTILALIMTVLMGGIIAYNGDLIGRKYGKRRVSLFNLRPKHTAILITSLTGIMISALTTAVLFLLVPPVRTIIMDGEDAIRQLPLLTNKNQRLSDSIKVEQLKESAARQRYEAARKQFNQIQATLYSEQTAVRKAQADLEAARTDLRRAEAATRTQIAANQQLVLQSAKLKKQKQGLENMNLALATANVALHGENDRLGKQNAQLADDVKVKEAQNRNYDEANAKLARQNEELGRDNERLEHTRDSLFRTAENLRKQVEELDATTTRLTEQNKRLAALKSEDDVSMSTLYHMFQDMRIKRVVVHDGDDLARTVIPAGQSVDAVHRALQQLMRQAHEAALARGAKPDDSNPVRAVRVVSKEFMAPTPFGFHRSEVTEQDRIDAMSHRLAMSDRPVCVLALAVANSLENEPAEIDFQPYQDRLIYPRAKKVASRRINASQPAEDLFLDVMAFLKDLGESARERGMIPRIDPNTGSPEVGALTWPELVRLVEQIRAHHGFVNVTALAARDTNASDALKMEFKVAPDI